MTTPTPQAIEHARDLLAFIDASPSPWHAVSTMADRLEAAGFTRLAEVDRWQLAPGRSYYVTRGGSSIIAFRLTNALLAEHGLQMIGAHTDSPGLRIKPRGAEDCQGMKRLGVEVYGGPILASFADRDLSLAGRVTILTQNGIETRLIHCRDPLLRLPNLAIHMNRDVNENGLKFNKQTELPLLAGLSDTALPGSDYLTTLLSDQLSVAADDLLTWDLCAYDTQPGTLWGSASEFIADSQLDNLASCHAALTALIHTPSPNRTALCAFFDHEEVGSESAAGASGSFLSDVLRRIAATQALDADGWSRMQQRSFFISADMAHAWHPNFPAAYEPCHRVFVNSGPVIKTNANQRYSTDAETAARFMAICKRAGVGCQQYAHRTDLGCGSTIGPILAAQLGVPSVDVGAPMWAMHSIRESAGVQDQYDMYTALGCALQG